MGDPDTDLRELLVATRSQVKALMSVARTTNQFLAQLEERLDAKPEEAQRNGHKAEVFQLR
jgi:hypothetical protein